MQSTHNGLALAGFDAVYTPLPGHYQMLPEYERFRQTQLDQEALSDMKVPRWTAVQHISDRFDTPWRRPPSELLSKSTATNNNGYWDIVAKSSLIHPVARSIMFALVRAAKNS